MEWRKPLYTGPTFLNAKNYNIMILLNLYIKVDFVFKRKTLNISEAIVSGIGSRSRNWADWGTFLSESDKEGRQKTLRKFLILFCLIDSTRLKPNTLFAFAPEVIKANIVLKFEADRYVTFKNKTFCRKKI